MELIDDESNLFGVVNVVDTLVVLLVLAVVAAGTAFVFQPELEGLHQAVPSYKRQCSLFEKFSILLEKRLFYWRI